jgi:nitrate reductase gamma subunit
MAITDETNTTEKPPATRYAFLAVAALLLVLGLAGQSHAAIGYALFMLATLMLLAGIIMLGLFCLTRAFDAGTLRRGYGAAFWMGGWTYVFAVSALSGYYVFEALSGRIELRYIIFGPAILAAIVVLDIGIYRVIVQRNMPTIRRFGDLWSREALDQGQMRQTLMNEVVLHRTLLTVHPFRWVRHQLIFWGFGLMFATELLAVAFREAFPAFGWTKLWYDTSHPIRIAFDLVYEVTGLMILVGCLLALGYRAMVNGTQDQKYTDTPTTVFLLVVVVTGFMAEGARLAHMSPDAPGMWASFVGRAFIPISPGSATGEEVIWIVHALAACAFIAYVPLKRMIHSCATPIGRLVNSQKGLLAAKKQRVMEGLARRWMQGPQ